MMTLYGRGQSRSFRVLWALHEAGVAFEYRHTPADALSDDYLALNPQGKSPTLVDGTLVMTESAAAVNYLMRSAGLLPTDAALSACYDEISYFVMTDFEQPLWTIGKHRAKLPEEYRHDGMFKTARYEFEKSQRALHHHMDGREYAVGDGFTGADILLAHTINWAERFAMPVAAVFTDYRDRMYARDPCKQAMAMVAEYE